MSNKPNIDDAINALEQTITDYGLEHKTVGRMMQMYRNGRLNHESPVSLVVSIKTNADIHKNSAGLPLKTAMALQQVSDHCRLIITEFMDYAVKEQVR